MSPILISERLVIRRPKSSDWPTVREFLLSPRSAAVGIPRNERDAWLFFCTILGHWEMCGFGLFSALSREDQTPLAFVGPWFPATWPKPELAIHLFTENDEGRGLGSEALLATLAHLFDDLGWSSIASFAARDNIRQRRLLERLGAVPKPTIKPPQDPLRDDLIAYCFERAAFKAIVQEDAAHD
ncbi:MAG: GNAT family N-acetyltransferase [Rhodobacterales bacterium]|nr:MAG: GNAT family N-acetyltransferase [Rhodobacterales bacterium]